MPNSKLKDNAIKKALEGAILNAKKCDSKVWSIEVYKLENALDLINCLQAQNKDLAETVHNLTIEKDALFDKAEELKAEIERLNALVKTKNKLIEGLDQSISYAYDRAIKDFAERLKEFMHNKFKALDEYEFEYITERDIDNLVKERVGEDNASTNK